MRKLLSLPLMEDITFSTQNDVSKHSPNIEAMACHVTSHDSKALIELKERRVFSRPAWNLLSKLVPPIAKTKFILFRFQMKMALLQMRMTKNPKFIL